MQTTSSTRRTPARRRRWLLALAVLATSAQLGTSPSVAAPPAWPTAPTVSTSSASAPLTVAQAGQQQSGSAATVRGYVVGQPTSTTTVVRSGYPGDTALALADTASETDTADMLYVQVPSAFRSSYGLRANPDLLGHRIDVSGALTAYFAHAGLTSPTAFSDSGSSDPGDPGDPGTSGPYDDTYYAAAMGKTGQPLEGALHTIIAPQTVLSYDQVWDALKATDEDPNNSSNVILLYTGRSQAKSTNGGGVDQWNREHVWAKSHGDFGTSNGPGTDVHHLRPTDVSVNSTRGNKDFDEGGSAVAEAPGNFTDADSWEPRDAVKGDVARMVFYMSVRYEGDDGKPDLEVNDSVDNGTAPHIGRLSVLLRWNAEDPPDAFEQHRNQVIYDDWQHNRNPFVDHPEWAASIWG